MKLNKTYKLDDVLKSLHNASDTVKSCREQAMKMGVHTVCYDRYETLGMLTTSPYARVTLTHKSREGRWDGYMEDSPYTDGPRVPVAVVLIENCIEFNDDYSHGTIQWKVPESWQISI